MELSDLQVFRAVVHAGGVTRAAAQLHRVPSNVTTRVRQLEDELGVALFLRERRRLTLTPAGRALLEYAERLLNLAREAVEALQDASPRGVLSLGAMESTAAVRLPAPLNEYHRCHPGVKLELRTGNPQQLAAAVIAGELEAALVAEPVADGPFEKIPVYEEELVLVARRGHAPIRAVRDLSPRTMLAFEPGCPHRKRLEEWFARQGQMAERVIEMSSYHALLGCAAAGMGTALVPRSVLTGFPGANCLSVHALPPAQNRAQTVLIWRKGARSSRLSALIDVLTEAGPLATVGKPGKAPRWKSVAAGRKVRSR